MDRDLVQTIGIIVAVLAQIAFLCVWSLVFGVALYRINKSVKEKIKLIEEGLPKLTAATEAISTGSEQWAKVPNIIEGHLRVAQKMVIEYARLHKVLTRFAGAVLASTPGDTPAYIPHDELEAAREADIKELLLTHPEFSREQAEQVTDSAFDYKSQALGVD